MEVTYSVTPAVAVNATKPNSISVQADRKCNAILYGIPEYSKGTKKYDWAKQDLTNVISTVSHVDSEITSQSIHDFFRLGKYKESVERSHPMLIKVTKAIDVISLSSNHSYFPNNISIKPDMSQAKRITESLLMKERWSLIHLIVNVLEYKLQIFMSKINYMEKSVIYHLHYYLSWVLLTIIQLRNLKSQN